MSFSVKFIGGIHGVGKGHMASYLSRKEGVTAYSASDLIKHEKSSPVDESKKVMDASANQDYLITAIKNLAKHQKNIILDGHFVLLKDEGFFNIPESTFCDLSISSIILKVCDPRVIYERLIQRDNEAPSITLLEEMQGRERSRAVHMAALLKVDLLVVDSDNYEKFFIFP